MKDLVLIYLNGDKKMIINLFNLINFTYFFIVV